MDSSDLNLAKQMNRLLKLRVFSKSHDTERAHNCISGLHCITTYMYMYMSVVHTYSELVYITPCS